MGGMLGCLPMLLQMPIWIALFTGLNSTVELRHAAFLPVWITDLAAPDRLIVFGRSVWLIGDSFNFLPLLVTAAMFMQMQLNPSTSAAAPSEQQAQQQKMMKYMMPVMMLVFFYKAPSGLNLYIMASTTVGALEQYILRRHIRQQDELAAAAETVVSSASLRPRGNKPKKPKSPFQIKH